MDYPDETVQQNVYLRGLKIAVFAIAMLGVVILLLSFKADNAAAVPVPSFSGTLYVSGDTVWDSGTATWSGSLYVQNGAKLTMKNCQVTLSYSYQYFYVYDGATVSMNNVSLINNNNIYGTYFWFSGTANIRINNTYMKNVYYMYICGYNTQITNSSIVN